MFRLLSILFDSWQANLSIVAKHWDSFLSHYKGGKFVVTGDCDPWSECGVSPVSQGS
jgi:hypothetical protein